METFEVTTCTLRRNVQSLLDLVRSLRNTANVLIVVHHAGFAFPHSSEILDSFFILPGDHSYITLLIRTTYRVVDKVPHVQMLDAGSVWDRAYSFMTGKNRCHTMSVDIVGECGMITIGTLILPEDTTQEVESKLLTRILKQNYQVWFYLSRNKLFGNRDFDVLHDTEGPHGARVMTDMGYTVAEPTAVPGVTRREFCIKLEFN